MRQYELVTVLSSEEEEFKAGKQAIADMLSQYKAIDVKEEDKINLMSSLIDFRDRKELKNSSN